MAWTSGTVTGHLNLLAALKTFLTTDASLVALSQQWAVEKDETIPSYTLTSPTVTTPTGGYGTTFRDLYLRGPGLAGTDAIHVNIRTYEAPTQGLLSWMIQGATDYDGGLPWERQPGNSWLTNNFRYLTLSNSTIDYWFIANGRRFIVIYKISGDFYASYCGFILPYALPSEFPYPMAVSGVTNNINSLPTDTGMSNFWVSDNDNPMMFRHRDGLWIQSVDASGLVVQASLYIWPWYPVKDQATSLQMMGHPDGSFVLLPAIAFSGHDNGNIYGEFDGVYYVPGLSPVVNPLSEDTITIEGVAHLVVQNIDKTNRHAYAAIKLA